MKAIKVRLFDDNGLTDKGLAEYGKLRARGLNKKEVIDKLTSMRGGDKND